MFPPVFTDAQGRFRLSGLGRDRLVSLELEGPQLAKDRISAVTRIMSPVPLPTSDPRARTERCFGASFDYTAEPTQVIAGTLRDLDSGEPIAGATVQVHQFANSLLGVQGFVTSTTDESGRYQLVGIPKPADGARPIRLEVLPNPDQPYFRTDITLSEKVDGLGPVTFDIELKRAVWVSGRVIDRQSSAPVTGYVSYYPFLENTVAVNYSNFGAGRTSVGHDNWYRTAADGSYRIPAIRGRGVVVARALAAPDYAIGAGAEQIGWESNPQDKLIYHLYGPELTNAVREVNIDADEATNQDVALAQLTRQRLRLLDPNGQPLSGVRVGGRRPGSALNETDVFHQAEPEEGPSVEAIGLQADGRRLMLFSHSDRKLGRAIIVDETTDAVTLEPLATFSGRLIDATGKPVEGQYVNVAIPKSESPEPNDKRAWGRRDQYLVGGPSDSDGRFHFGNVLPGMKCVITVNNKTLASRDDVEPGDVVEWGDLRVAMRDEEGQAILEANAATSQVSALPADRPGLGNFTIAGRVLGPDGKPVPGAKLYFAPHQHATPQDLQVRAVTDGSGKFSFAAPVSDLERLAGGLRAPWSHPRVTARFDGLGPDWQYIVEPEGNEDLTLRLVHDDVPIEGQVVTIEGRAVPDATIHVLRVEASPLENLQEWLDALNNAGELWAQETFKLTKTLNQDVSGLPAHVRTDEQGRFRITGLGRERVVNLRVEGLAIETREFSAMTRDSGTIRVPYDKEEPSHGTLICYGTGFSHPAAPSRPLVGTVVDAVSGQPVSGVTVFCYKRAGNPVHGRYQPETVTDENGKFLLTGLPKGVDNKIQFLPPSGQRHSPMVQIFDTNDGLDPLVVEVKMNPGVLISGRVTDESTGQPVPRANVSYFALRNENVSLFPGFRNSDDITTTTDADGRYQIFGLPGRGLIAVRAKSHEFAAGYAIDTVQADSRFEAGLGDRAFITEPRICLASQYHAVAVVQAQENARNVRDIRLQRGRTLTVKIVGPDGEPLSGAEVNRQGIEACQLRGGDVEIDGSEFTAWGLTEGKPRTLFVRHRAQGLAAARIVRHDDQEPIVIRLERAGTIVGRLLDQNAPASFVEFTGGLSSRQTQQRDWLRVTSDKAGRFRIEGLVPGEGYRLRNFQRALEGYVFSSRESGEPVDFIMKSGETVDLGDVIVE